MSSPYINTYLYDTVVLHPNQMNNDMYNYLKQNLIHKRQNKCYKSYGYISRIYKIEEKNRGKIIAEDNSASAFFDVKFSCKLCKPLIGSTIICEVKKINKSAIYLTNGPINVFLFENSDHINSEKFYYDDKRNIYIAKISDNKGVPVVIGTYVKILVTGTNYDSNRIIAAGFMDGVASKKEIEDMISERESIDYNDNIIPYDEYIKQEYIEEQNIDEKEDETIEEGEGDNDNNK